jgi:hypothetical protein
MSDVLLLLAVACFSLAAYIDAPIPHWPDRSERTVGNFCCSLGFVCFALGMYLR